MTFKKNSNTEAEEEFSDGKMQSNSVAKLVPFIYNSNVFLQAIILYPHLEAF